MGNKIVATSIPPSPAGIPLAHRAVGHRPPKSLWYFSRTNLMTEAIYQRPDDYDLEHEGRDEDIDGLVRLIKARRPKRVLELGAGSGRLAIPLARVGAREAFDVVGLEPA